jgi:hypothetical protein
MCVGVTCVIIIIIIIIIAVNSAYDFAQKEERLYGTEEAQAGCIMYYPLRAI